MGSAVAVYAELAPVVRKVVVARLRNDDEIEDSIHDVFIQIFRHIGNLRDPACARPWAERIANNVVNGVIRKRELFRKHSTLYARAVGEHTHVPDPVGRAFARRVIEALSRLPTKDRDLLYDYWFEPLTHEQLAALSNCSTSKLTRLLHRAQARFNAVARGDRYLSSLGRTQ